MELIFEARDAEEGGSLRPCSWSRHLHRRTWDELRANVLDGTSLHFETRRRARGSCKRYLPECINALGAHHVHASNLLPSQHRWRYGAGDFEEFVGVRSSLISETVRDLCDGKWPE